MRKSTNVHFIQACEQGNVIKVGHIIDQIQNQSDSSNNKDTLLALMFSAIYSGNREVVDVLLMKGIPLEVEHFAHVCRFQDFEMSVHLFPFINSMPNKHVFFNAGFIGACFHGHTEMAQWLLKKTHILVTEKHLVAAVEGGKIEMVRFLFEQIMKSSTISQQTFTTLIELTILFLGFNFQFLDLIGLLIAHAKEANLNIEKKISLLSDEITVPMLLNVDCPLEWINHHISPKIFFQKRKWKQDFFLKTMCTFHTSNQNVFRFVISPMISFE